MSMKKKSSDPLGIEPATFRFVAQCLNHYATACPYAYITIKIIIIIIIPKIRFATPPDYIS
jgi:hypothetical protein